MKILRIAVAALAAAFMLGGAAQAQVPNLQFPPLAKCNTICYTQEIGSTPGYQVDISNMAGQLRQAASQLGSSAGRSAQIFEVIVKEPAGGVNDPKAGGLIAQTIMNKWSQNGFPDDGILLVLTRSAANPNQWMAGARLGRSFAGSVGLPELGSALSGNIDMLRSGDYRGYSGCRNQCRRAPGRLEGLWSSRLRPRSSRFAP